MLAVLSFNCSVFASLFAKYPAVLAALCSSLVPPFFHCFQALRFSITALFTSLFHHQVSLCREHPPRVYSNVSSAASRSPFLIYSQALSTSAGICWHFINAASSNSFCTAGSFTFQVSFLVEYGWIWRQVLLVQQNHRQVTCVMHSSLLGTFVSLIFFSCALVTRMKSMYAWLPPDEKVISLLLFLRKKVLVIASLLATEKSGMRNPSWLLIPYPLSP